MNNYIAHFAFTAFCLSSSTVLADYHTKSKFTEEYKCTVEESGGYNHSKAGHQLGRFRAGEEYYLRHISRLPKKTLKNMLNKEIVKALDDDEELLISEVEAIYLKIDDTLPPFHIEKNSYFIRDTSIDPDRNPAIVSSCEAVSRDDELIKISCDMYAVNFEFYPSTGRFVASSYGNWARETASDYDSTVFQFGTCKEFYN